MNQAELNALYQSISNDARTLYCLGLRPLVDEQTGVTQLLQYKQLRDLLNSKEQKFLLGRQLNSLFKELFKVGLIALDQNTQLDKSLNGKSIVLPLVILTPDQHALSHLQWQAMDNQWQPDPELFNDLAQLTGLLDKNWQQQDLGEFIAYWRGRPEVQFSQYQWTQKFVSQLKHKRRNFDKTTVKVVGTQQVPNKIELSVNQNVKNLVKKYSEKPENKN